VAFDGFNRWLHRPQQKCIGQAYSFERLSDYEERPNSPALSTVAWDEDLVEHALGFHQILRRVDI
jgi:hypothetical protein